MNQTSSFHDLAYWLQERALTACPLTDTLRELGNRIILAGIPIERINCGGLMLHPVLGAQDLIWTAATDHCSIDFHTRLSMGSEEFTNAPFFQMAQHKTPYLRIELSDPVQREQYPVLERLFEDGSRDYVAFYVSYDKQISLPLVADTELFECATFSFTINRESGFTSSDIENLRILRLPLALAIKSTLNEKFAQVLMETYLGRLSGRNVLSGNVQKGDGRMIDCVLWYSDMRGSTRLSVKQDMINYFKTINEYFDCTAGAVIDSGGEVLKFIGDGVFAIFPIGESETNLPTDVGKAAVSTAHDAFARLGRLNNTRVDFGLPPLDFGIALHVGQVIFGNVGVEKRMDMTVTGPAANEVARLEVLCKQLDTPIVASSAFASLYSEGLESMGVHVIPDLGNETEIFKVVAADVRTSSVGQSPKYAEWS